MPVADHVMLLQFCGFCRFPPAEWLLGHVNTNMCFAILSVCCGVVGLGWSLAGARVVHKCWAVPSAWWLGNMGMCVAEHVS